MFETFYNETIRNTVIAFGSLFNEIYVIRKDSGGNETSRFKVPVTYGPKEKFIRILDEYSQLKSLDNPRDISTIIPRIGFSIETLSYDAERKRNTLSKRYSPSSIQNSINFEYAEVPYIVDFNMTILSRTMEDALQIVEQVLAYFTPEFTISVNFKDRRQKLDIPIILTGVSSEIDFEGDSSVQRSIIFTLTFSAKTYIFGPQKTAKLITTVDTTLFDSQFDSLGGITGGTAAVSRVITGVTGPSGSDSTIETFTGPDTTIFEVDISGATI